MCHSYHTIQLKFRENEKTKTKKTFKAGVNRRCFGKRFTESTQKQAWCGVGWGVLWLMWDLSTIKTSCLCHQLSIFAEGEAIHCSKYADSVTTKGKTQTELY